MFAPRGGRLARFSRLLPVALAAFPATAAARQTGIVGYSGKQGVHCGDCHFAVAPGELARPVVAPAINAYALGELAVGATTAFRVRVRSVGPVGTRGLGLGMAVSGAPGDLDAALAEVREPDPWVLEADELRHGAPVAFEADSIAEPEFRLTPRRPGAHVLYVAVNDSDNSGFADGGDRIAMRSFCFDVPGAVGPVALPACDGRLDDGPLYVAAPDAAAPDTTVDAAASDGAPADAAAPVVDAGEGADAAARPPDAAAPAADAAASPPDAAAPAADAAEDDLGPAVAPQDGGGPIEAGRSDESPPADDVHPGDAGCACDAAPGPAVPLPWLAALLLATRRRRL